MKGVSTAVLFSRGSTRGATYRVSDLTMRTIIVADGPPRSAGELVRIELVAGPHRLELQGRVGASTTRGVAVELAPLDFGRREALATVVATSGA